MRIKLIVRSLCISLIVLGLITVGHSEAQIDSNTIVGIWSLDEGNGDMAGDASENERNGDIQGAKWEKGQVGEALNFEKGDTVVVPLGNGIVRNVVSVVLWLQFSDLAGQQNYFSIWDSSDNRYVPYKTDAHELRFWSNNWNVGSSFIVEKNRWYHVANVYDGKTVSIYVDGELKISQQGTFSLSDNQQTSWFATDKGGWLSSCIEDEIGIFTAALTADEVKFIMEHGISWALSGAPVEQLDKLSTTWGTIKTQRLIQ